MGLAVAFALQMLTFLSLASGAGAQCVFAHSAARTELTELTYRFALRPSGDTSVLRVTVQFTGSPSGVDTIAVPNSWAGEQLHAVRNLRAVDSGVSIELLPDGRKWVATAPSGTRDIRLSYDLAKDWAGPLNHPYEFHPMIFADYVEMTGSNALVHPRLDRDSPVAAHFDWTGTPSSWSVATSFGAGDRCQSFTGSWRQVSDGLFSAGDFRVHRFTIRNQPALLAIRGTWTFSDSDVVAEVQRDIGVVRAFWNDDAFPYFLVTWAPFDRDHGSSDGTGFTNALWILMSKLDPVSTQTTQLTHEAFHAWDPRRMGPEPDGEERRIGWFHEGFTTYYADEIAYRAGLISLARVVRRANQDLRDFAASDDKYVRGDVIARWLDGVIRDESRGTRSLDDVMRDMVRSGAEPLTLERVLSTANKYIGPAEQAELRELATGRHRLPTTISPGELAPCVYVTVDSEVPQLHIRADYVPRQGACGLSAPAVSSSRLVLFKGGMSDERWAISNVVVTLK